MSRRRALVVAGVAMLWLAGALVAPAAWAHGSLVSSTPPDGASLTTAPTSVVLEFSAELQPIVQVVVSGPDGASLLRGEPVVVGRTVTQAVAAGGVGQYSLAYRVTATDGDPITGQVGFAVGEPVAERTVASEDAAAPSADAAPDDVPAAVAAADDASGSTLGSRDLWVPIVLFAGAAACWWLSRRVRPSG